MDDESPQNDSEIDSTRKRRLSLVAHGTENHGTRWADDPGESWGKGLETQLHLLPLSLVSTLRARTFGLCQMERE